MPSNFTGNYQLNQWAAGDRVLRTDFNADNAKIDAAIKAVDQRVDGKANISALSALQTTIAQKADVSALAAKGNCQVEYGTYVGTGVCGLTEDKATVLPLGYRPKMIFIWNENDERIGFFFYPCNRPMIYSYSNNIMVMINWTDNGLSWWCSTTGTYNDASQLNKANVTYHYAAFR